MDLGNRQIFSNGNFVSGQISEIDPNAQSAPRAYTGDSAIIRVRVAKEGGSASVLSVSPFFISDFRTGADQMVVRPLEALVNEPLPDVWHRYYAYRYEVMKGIEAAVASRAGAEVAETEAR